MPEILTGVSQMRLSRRKWIIITTIAVLAYPVYYLASPLFIVTRVSEPLPDSNLVAQAQGTFQNGAPGHSAIGTAILYKTSSGSYLVRFGNFRVTNGPDLNVYLSRSSSPGSDYIDLGNLRGSVGDQNYDAPSSFDPNQYRFVLVWCVSFSVLFGYAELI